MMNLESRDAIKRLRPLQSQNGCNSYDLGMKDPTLCNHRKVLLMQDILEILELPDLSTVQDILVILATLHQMSLNMSFIPRTGARAWR